MTQQIDIAPTIAETGEYAPVQEIRLAVVMYGGVSLAIYMNGVAQEFLNLVMATAPAKDDQGNATDSLLWPEDQLPPSARVYRALGRMLDGSGSPCSEIPRSGKIRTRFVIDIVTGTSAGGINGVFLAKALANQEEMGGLTRMWRTEGDLPKLLNDGSNPAVLKGGAPDALLNSRRILTLFNEAITGMKWDESGARPDLLACRSPYVEELDLFVTTTDMTGLLLPVRLEDRVIYERRYRNFYHFRYGYPAGNGAPYNCFQPLNTTFLAFACRCTSAFPFAFAPMDLETAVSLCGQPKLADWTGFYTDYLNAARTTAKSDGGVVRRDQSVDFAHRYFIDGGCLDNKPFSYAIDALRWKQSDIPVTRKLFYLEPAPSHPEFDRNASNQPDALDSVFSGYVDLPRAENIREDLQRLLDRNQLILRLKDALSAVAPVTDQADTESWSRTTIQQLRGAAGPGAAAYAAYHRMKVSAVTDSIATTIVCAAGLDAESDDALAVRYLVKAWRNETYPDIMDPAKAHPAAAREKRTSANFLLQFDLDYRVRRLSFVRREIDAYFRHYANSGGVYLAVLAQAKNKINDIRRHILRTDGLARSHDPQSGNPILPVLKRIETAITGGAAPNGTAAGFSGLVQQILAKDSESERLAEAARYYHLIEGTAPAGEPGPIHTLATELAKLYAHARVEPRDETLIGLFEASQQAVAVLKKTTEEVPPIEGKLHLIASYDGYESYDAATFPLLYGTGVGEVKEVEVVRVSPDDATPLCSRRRGTAKLAGDSLGHFGGFLAQDWREHDILWGRLDGVDRIVNGIAPGLEQGVRDALVREGQIAILQEWLKSIGSPLDGPTLYDLLKNPTAAIPAPASQSGNGWKLTPAQVIQSAREGAAAGLQGMTNPEAVVFGQRSLAVVSSMGYGLANRRSAAWTRTPLSLTGDLLAAASMLLRLGLWPWIILMVISAALVIEGIRAGVSGLWVAGIFLVAAGVAGLIARNWLASKTAALLGAKRN